MKHTNTYSLAPQVDGGPASLRKVLEMLREGALDPSAVSARLVPTSNRVQEPLSAVATTTAGCGSSAQSDCGTAIYENQEAGSSKIISLPLYAVEELIKKYKSIKI